MKTQHSQKQKTKNLNVKIVKNGKVFYIFKNSHQNQVV